MSATFTESIVEQAALAWFESIGYATVNGATISPNGEAPERDSFSEVILPRRLQDALARLNPGIPSEALDEAFRKLTRIHSPLLIDANHEAHDYLVNGIPVEFLRSDGTTGYAPVRAIDFDDPENNDFLAVNQFTVIEGYHTRRADVVVFVNGLPLGLFELKNAADENATIWDAFEQLQTYKRELGALFTLNELLVISDGVEARLGTLSSDRERFQVWRTIEGEAPAPRTTSGLETLIRGVFERRRLLDLLRHFIVFETSDEAVIKKVAAYHQFHAVNAAIDATLTAIERRRGAAENRRIGVVWHTQGSGKSLTMAFYTGRLVLHPALQNPTIVVLTDRNDLDDQLFGTFARCRDLLRQDPVQADDRGHLRELLAVESGGVVFTTLQKFAPEARGDAFPCLTDRANVVVIADEAHRSQYDFIDGFARHLRDALPGAAFIGFTGTPIEAADRSTRAVFGDDISVYDIQRAVEDGATVPIYYESRLAKLTLREEARPRIDAAFDEVTEGEELAGREKLKSKWSALEAIAGTEQRVELIAADLVAHFEERLGAMDGKAMVVCMSRRICVELYEAICRLRPEWHSGEDATGAIKVVMTGCASDPAAFQPHVRSKKAREALAARFRDPDDPLKIVIVRDMWLTGFDAPCLHTMYLDKPMRGHGLMQAIARVNRVFRDKPGGLVVDYLGVAEELKAALRTYTDCGGQGRGAIDQEEAVRVMLARHELCCDLFHGFDWSGWHGGTATDRLSLLPAALEHILAQAEGKERFCQVVTELSKAFALAIPSEAALHIRDDVGFFQAVRAALGKAAASESARRSPEALDGAIRQIVSGAIASGEVIDLFSAAGLKSPDISILSDAFLEEVRAMPQKHLAVELLRRLIGDELKARVRRNLVQSRSFSKLLEQAIRRYQNRTIGAAQVIDELIELAQRVREGVRRGEKLGLTEDELAFYDALCVSEAAVREMGEGLLCEIARELIAAVRRNTSIDWTEREAARAKMRAIVKRLLKRHGYPPEQQDSATETVIAQAGLFSDEWAREAA